MFHQSLSSSSSFLGSRSMMSFENAINGGGNRLKRQYFWPFDEDENGVYEELHQPEKKRRLSAVQVLSLEKTFELDNKLEPERKIQIAKDLGLHPRQVAIWFQNRRARWKTSQLEKDYEVLQATYNSLKADFDNILKEQHQLKAEVLLLTEKLLLKEKESGNSQLSDTNNLSVTTYNSKQVVTDKQTVTEFLDSEVSKNSVASCKQDDVMDSDSSLNSDVGHSLLLKPGDHYPYAFESGEQSDLSQDEDDDLSKNLLPQYIFPKLEDADYSEPPTNSCNYGFPVEDNAIWSWSY